MAGDLTGKKCVFGYESEGGWRSEERDWRGRGDGGVGVTSEIKRLTVTGV